MPYFPVDDQVPFHPKIVAAGNGAVGLWTRSGAWCKAHTSGGKIPQEIARLLGTKTEANRLVQVGLWLVTSDGYEFHDWAHQAGNFDADTEKQRREEDRERNRERKRKQREREKSQSHGESHGVTPGGVTGGVTAPPSPVPSPSPETRLNTVGHLPEREGEIDVEKVIVAVQKHCGRECSVPHAWLVIGTVMDRAKVQPKNKTAFVVKAIERDPFEFQKLIDEVVES